MDYSPNIIFRVKTKAVPHSHKCLLQYITKKKHIEDPKFPCWYVFPVRETAKPSKAKQSQAKPSKAKQSQAKPRKAKQSEAKQSQAKPSKA
jgi:hypothetical protein